MFGLKAGWASLFGAVMLAMILATHLFWPARAPIARYDALVAGAVLVQAAMLTLRLEDGREAIAILLFHIAATGMEVFKTATASWS